MKELDEAAQICADNRKLFNDEKTKLGIGGFPGLEDRFIEVIETSERQTGIKSPAAMRNMLYTGYLGGISAMMRVITEIKEVGLLDRIKIIESLHAELQLGLLEQEIMTMKEILRQREDEG